MMWHSVKRVLAWEASERRLLIQAVVMLPLTALGLRLFGFNRCYKGLARLTTGRFNGTMELNKEGLLGKSEQEATIRRTLRIMRLAVRHGFYGGNCLSRSLTLWWLLRRQGITSDLRIGIRRRCVRQKEAGTRTKGEQLEAHAWVELEGYPLNESEHVHQRYVAFEQPIVPRGSIIRR